MAYSFYLGSSGSEKTERAFLDMIEASLEDPEERFFVLVPEQYSMLVQKKLLALHPRHASRNLEALSLNRLAYRVFQERNVQLPPIMDESGKAMVVRRVGSLLEKELTLWKGKVKKAGFAEQVKSMISECLQYGAAPSRFAELAATEKKRQLSMKLRDFSLLYQGVRDFVQGKQLPKEEILGCFAGCIASSELLRGAHILLAGFVGFTPVQYRVLEELLAVAADVRFVVSLDTALNPYRQLPEEELFHLSTEYIHRIGEIADRVRVPHGEDRSFPGAARLKAPELAFLDAHALRYDGAVYPDKVQALTVAAQESPEAEAAALSRHILRLVKDEGYRYRDIAVVVADFQGLGEFFSEALLAAGIPAHLDENLTVRANPLPELLNAALLCVRENFSPRTFFRFLHNPLVTDQWKLTALLENYVTLTGVRHLKRLREPFSYCPKELEGADLEALNRFKEEMLNLLLPLREAFSEGEADVAVIAALLEGLMEQLAVEEKLQHAAERFLAAGEAPRAREFSEVYPETQRILREMREVLAGERLSRADMAGVLESGLREIHIGQIPAYADRVTLGDLTRTRFLDVKVLFLLAANDSVLPKRREEGGVLSEREREALRAAGLTLAPGSKAQLYEQRFYLYRLLTEASEQLHISYSTVDRSGKALRPSFLLRHLEQLFPRLRAAAPETGERFYSTPEAEQALIRALRAARKAAEENGVKSAAASAASLLSAFAADTERKREAGMLADAACALYAEGQLFRETALALYGEVLTGSVTRVEEYFRCPFRHFANYGLRLRQLPEFQIAQQDLGSLAHRAIELVFRAAAKAEKSPAAYSDEELRAAAADAVREAVEADASGLYKDSAKNRWIVGKLTRIVTQSILVMAEQLRRGSYRPLAEELRFSSKDAPESTPALSVGSMQLRGNIDRVDTAEHEGKLYVKVVDYKTGATSWEPYKILSGSQLQLLIYLSAITELFERQYPDKEILPGAVFYAPVGDAFVDLEKIRTEEALRKAKLKELTPSGLINSDETALTLLAGDGEDAADFLPVRTGEGKIRLGENTVDAGRFFKLQAYAKEKLREAGEAILGGNVRVLPLEEDGHTSCEYCPYRDVCAFDANLTGYKVRRNKKQKAEEVFAEIDRAAGEETGR